MSLFFEPYIWIAATLGAALGQSIRSVVQKHLNAELGLYGSAFVRFIYGLPAAWILFFILLGTFNPLTHLPFEFYLWLIGASLIQIIFTLILGLAFQQRNFATSIALSKTDALQAAIFELIFLAIIPHIHIVIAISLGMVAVFLLTLARSGQIQNWRDSLSFQTVLLGLSGGFCLGLCSVMFRIAMDMMEGTPFLDRAILTSTLAITFQTFIMGMAMLLFVQDELQTCLKNWARALPAGTIAACTTLLWFVAFTHNGVAPVRMLGHVEILFSLFFGVWFFKEKMSKVEILGVALISISVIILLSQPSLP